jgi:hypothetical protein
MPLEQAIWKIGARLTKLNPSTIAKEIDLESYIDANSSILSSGWLIIGRQVASDVGPIDLLAVDQSGALAVIELKKQQTTRDITAQALDYAAWVENLTSDEIAGIYKRYCDRYRPQDTQLTLDNAFRRRFGTDLPVEELNASHRIILVASELDARTERIVRYLSRRGIEMNVLFFQVFADGDQQFLSRVWMLDEVELEEQVTRGRSEILGEWNGEYYVSFGVFDDGQRNWDDAVKYGYISAGGGRWYHATLEYLTPGARVWVKVPGKGFVGVGEVTGTSQRALDFSVVKEDGSLANIIEVSKSRAELLKTADDADKSEYFVPVRWIKTLPIEKAINEIGLFGNQHSVCKPRTSKWVHTVERLKQLFDIA